MDGVSGKSRTAAALLAFFLGTLGIHRFYIGKIGTGLTLLLLGVAGWILFIAGSVSAASLSVWTASVSPSSAMC